MNRYKHELTAIKKKPTRVVEVAYSESSDDEAAVSDASYISAKDYKANAKTSKHQGTRASARVKARNK